MSDNAVAVPREIRISPRAPGLKVKPCNSFAYKAFLLIVRPFLPVISYFFRLFWRANEVFQPKEKAGCRFLMKAQIKPSLKFTSPGDPLI